MQHPELPRPLWADERAAIEALLDRTDFSGRDELRRQLDSTEVVGHCDCGCATVDLAVDPALAPAGGCPRPVPADADVVDERGEVIGGVILFATDGYLSSLEVYSYDETLIAPFPPLARLRVH